MFPKLWSRLKSVSLFSEFATKSIAELIKIALSTATTAITNVTPLGIVVGEGTKGIVEALNEKSTRIEKKLDKIIREPFITGIKLLQEGFSYTVKSKEDQSAKDKILHDAHVFFTRAWVLANDSEDSLFIQCLDLIALATHSSNWQLAAKKIIALEVAINNQESKVKYLESQAKDHAEYSAAVKRFLESRPYRDVPHGYAEQKLFGKSIHKYSAKLTEKSIVARERVDILINLKNVAQNFIQSYTH